MPDMFKTGNLIIDREEYYGYLDRLRNSGRINMFAAVPYLMKEYDISKKQASEMLQDWMTHFGK